MRELHGVIASLVDLYAGQELKQIALLFDRLHMPFADSVLAGRSAYWEEFKGEPLPAYQDFKFLRSQGFIADQFRGDRNTLNLEGTIGNPQFTLDDFDFELWAKEVSLVTRKLALDLESQGHQAVAVFGSINMNDTEIFPLYSERPE